MHTDFAIDVRANNNFENQYDTTTMETESRFLINTRSNCPPGQKKDRTNHCREVFKR